MINWQKVTSFAVSLDTIISSPKTFVSKLRILILFLIVTSILPVGLWLLYTSPLIQSLPFFGVVHVVFAVVAVTLFFLLGFVMNVGFGYWGTLWVAFKDSESGYLNGLSSGQAGLLGAIRLFVQLLYVAVAGSAVAFIIFNVQVWQVLPDPGVRTGIVERTDRIGAPQEWKLEEAYVTDPTSMTEATSWPADTTLLVKKHYSVPPGVGVRGMELWLRDTSYWKSFGTLVDIDCDGNSCSADVRREPHGAGAGRLQSKFTYRASANFRTNEYSASSDRVELKIVATYQQK